MLSDYILEELRRVLPKLAHRHGLSTIDIDDLVDTLSIQADVIEPAEPEGIVLHDIDDQPALGTLLAALRSSGADYLITGDRVLLAVAQHYPVISPADFRAAHGMSKRESSAPSRPLKNCCGTQVSTRLPVVSFPPSKLCENPTDGGNAGTTDRRVGKACPEPDEGRSVPTRISVRHRALSRVGTA